MNITGLVHTAFAVTAIISGAAVLLRAKGTASHRVIGWVYVGTMVGTNGTALMIYRLFGGFGPFHAAALLSLGTLVPGVVSAVRRRPGWLERHYWWMTYSYVGLMAATASEILTRVPGLAFGWAVVVATLAVLIVGAALVRGRFRKSLAPFRDFRGHNRLRRVTPTAQR